MSVRIATVIGATGMIGSHLLKLLQKDDYFTTIRVLVRRPFSQTNFKTVVKLVDFADEESFKMGIEESHTVFCTIGTTMKKVNGDKEAYRKVDFDIAVKAARYCRETGCNQFLLVSAVGADPKSLNFYLRLKGEVEEEVKSKKLPSVVIFRPSMLLGARGEERPAEKFGQAAMQALSFLIPSKYKPIAAGDVAQSMLTAAKQNHHGFKVYEYREMKEAAGSVHAQPQSAI